MAVSRNNSQLFLAAGIVSICAILLFIPWNDVYHPRSLKTLWNLGHFPLFACTALLGLRYFNLLNTLTYEIQLLVVLGLACVVGLAIEYIQLGLGRNFSLGDVAIDLAGAFFTIAWFATGRAIFQSFPLICRWFSIGLIIIGLFPLYLNVSDEISAREQFPQLATFESKLELERFRGSASLRLENGVVRITFGTEKYSFFALNYFPRDWRDYQTLQLHFNNLNQQAITLTCRIHDIWHDQSYDDRYNKTHTIYPGETTIIIELDDVRTQPKSRELELSKVGQLACFTSQQRSPVELILKQINLA
ncbi:MAG: hypothetical protein AAF512_03350 [Pseudomonadota bacterium]